MTQWEGMCIDGIYRENVRFHHILSFRSASHQTKTQLDCYNCFLHLDVSHFRKSGAKLQNSLEKTTPQVKLINHRRLGLSAKAILGRLLSSKLTRYSRRYRIHYAMADVKLGTRQVRLFFCRRSRYSQK